MDAFNKTKEAIKGNDRFIITTHVNPDGDGIGSELGLLRFLRSLGKEARVVNSTFTPRKYQFLERPSEIFLYDPHDHSFFDSAQVIFILDISKWERLGPMHHVVQNHPALKICIDHHPLCGDFADVNWICQEACASGELVLQLIAEMQRSLTREIAEPIYASILTDTGAFRFPNTNSRTHAAASLLLETGINPAQIYEQIYERCSPARVKLLGMVLSNLEYMHEGRLAWAVVTQEMLMKTGVEPEEVEGFVDIARGIKDVLASLLFLELPDGRVKVSLRSKGLVDVNSYASQFGGGGHQHASGIMMRGPVDEAVQRVLQNSHMLFASELVV
ncbi:MAG TPA: bifunctional oligoribonuclease/PAP phosphatase NrnA [Acidobacteriota bacterium]|nr:bifunctional oligoribonuclease/PAP phosphatase NrnA [Acidobacteriota bacterium]